MKRAAVILVTLLTLAPAARADSLGAIFERANSAYFRGDYDEAVVEYRRLLEAGVVDPDVAYNLGAAEAQRGRYGAAIHHLERALWLRPGDEDAERALAEVRGALGSRRAEARGESEVQTGSLGEALFGGVSPDLLATLALLFDFLLFAALAALVFVRRESLRLAAGVGAVLFTIGLFVSGAGAAVQSGWLDEGEPAVVLTEGLPLREGPDARASTRSNAPEGDRAWVLDVDRGWARVRVPGVGEGWVQRDAIGMVRASR